MGVYKPRDKQGREKTPFFHYDFVLRPKGARQSQRFYGSTGQRTKKAADRVEAQLRELAALGQLTNSMTVDEGCQRYWNEKLIHGKGADNQASVLEDLCTYFGKDTLLISITPDMISQAAERRSRTPVRRYNRRVKEVITTKKQIMPSPSTVNRQVIEPMRRLLRRAKKAWGIPIDLEQFDWGALSYSEPAERVREMQPEEEERFWAVLREDYHPYAKCS